MEAQSGPYECENALGLAVHAMVADGGGANNGRSGR